MRAIAVDDETMMLEDIVEILQESQLISEVHGFGDPQEALDWAENNMVDVAFLDIKMFGMSGIELAAKLKREQPRMHIVFLTGYSDYMQEAFRVRAEGYLLKPTSAEDVEGELLHMKEWDELWNGNGKRVKIQTFGTFEVYVDEKPLVMSNSKSKEMLAYLVDRKGAAITMAELASVLWEDAENDRNAKSYVRKAIIRLQEALKENQCENIVEKSRNSLRVVPEQLDCDYYSFLKGDITAVNAFAGEYMSNYSWAEFTTGYLNEKIK